MGKIIIEALIDGGKATPAPPLGPQLAVYKMNIGKVIQDINEKTKEYEGMKVPIKIIIDDVTKEYDIKIGTPPVSSLIRKELGLKKIAPEKKEEEVEEKEEEGGGKKEDKKVLEEEVEETEKKGKKKELEDRVIVGDLTIEQCIKITKMKRECILAKDMKKALKEIVATVVSMPVTIEGKSPKEILKEIDDGKYDSKLGLS